MDSNDIIAIASLVADVAAFCGVYVAYRAFKTQEESFRNSSEALRLSVSAYMISRLEDKFNSDAVKRSRDAASRALLNGQNFADTEDLFDFFEAAGLLNRLGALDEDMVHCTFFHWINLYWTAGREYIVRTRKERSSSMWTEFESIYNKTRGLEERADPHSRDLDLSPEVVRVYLNKELLETEQST